MTHLAAIGTQVEKLGKAARILMPLTLPPQKRIGGAMVELDLGFLENPPYRQDSEAHLNRLRSLLSGEGSSEAIFERLSPEGREHVSEAFWQLHQSVMHAFYKEMHRQSAANHPGPAKGDKP